MSITIHNLRNEKIQYPWDIRVDRKNCALGNQFFMSTEEQRDEVCDKYRRYLLNSIKCKIKKVCDELNRIHIIYKTYGKLRLFCWCAPKRCHAETIRYVLLKVKS